RPAAAPLTPADGRPPCAEPEGAPAGQRPAAPVPTTEGTGAGGAVAAPPPSPVRDAAGPLPSPVRDAAGRPPLPVRGATPVPVNTGDGTSDGPAVPPPFPPLSTLSAEELLADQPSLDMLRRVRRGLRALPESDGHLSD
ncbi:hypothetical protein PV332_36795, partial [Streptomyces scabiei]